MLPPFLAAYGLYTSNQTLLQLAYDQIKLYRDLLRIQEGPGENMFMHIYNSTNITNSDTGAWATGNGWSTAGMVRVLASIAQSPFSDQMVQQKTDLANWTNEILDAAYPFLDQGSGLFHNYINATTEFNDASGSAIIACEYRYKSTLQTLQRLILTFILPSLLSLFARRNLPSGLNVTRLRSTHRTSGTNLSNCSEQSLTDWSL